MEKVSDNTKYPVSWPIYISRLGYQQIYHCLLTMSEFMPDIYYLVQCLRYCQIYMGLTKLHFKDIDRDRCIIVVDNVSHNAINSFSSMALL